MLSKLLLTCGAAFAVAASAAAELRWEKPLQQFEGTPDDKKVEARFAFKNAGSAPVTITKTRTSCGCTTAKLEKKTYQPGETGEITAVFTFGGRKGLHRKTITVTTDDAAATPAVLDMRVFIHEPLEVKPSLVYWRTGDLAGAKGVRLTANGQPVRIKSVTSSSTRITAMLETIKVGEEYQVAITPADTAQKESAEITVLTDFPSAAPRSYTIHARVK